MMTEKNASDSDLGTFINVDPLLQNMPNITLALFLLLEKSSPGEKINLLNLLTYYLLRLIHLLCIKLIVRVCNDYMKAMLFF